MYVSYVEQIKLINKSDDLPRRSCMFSRFLVQFSIKLNDSMKTTKQKTNKRVVALVDIFPHCSKHVLYNL